MIIEPSDKRCGTSEAKAIDHPMHGMQAADKRTERCGRPVQGAASE
jgi:hypothetical protein